MERPHLRIHSSSDGHMGRFHLAVSRHNNAIYGHVSVGTYAFLPFGYIPRSESYEVLISFLILVLSLLMVTPLIPLITDLTLLTTYKQELDLHL